MRSRYLTSLLVAFAAGGCAQVSGNGQQTQETRALTGFNQVANHGSLDVKVTQGAFLVVVKADSNLLPILTTTVTNGVLIIGATKSYSSSDPVEVDVTMPTFAGADNQGSGSVSISVGTPQAIALSNGGSGQLSFSGPAGAVTIDLSGSSSTTLKGSGASLDGSLSGSGSLDASLFPVGESTFNCSGSGNSKLTVNGNATLGVNGSGNIQATLNGGIANFSVSGSGSIDWSGGATVGKSSLSGSGSVNHH